VVPLFDETDFARLRFLEGRWRGAGPDGTAFFESYALVEPTVFRSERYADAGFETPIDGSTVTLLDGVAVSAWGPFSWRATMLTATRACFEPLDAPSSFCWEQASPDTVTVTQRWTDAEGTDHRIEMALHRIVG
jgi:hypothetical protein